MKAGTLEVLNRLSETLLARRNADPSTSYTASLFAKGPDAILKKIGEEASEVIIAAKNADPVAKARMSVNIDFPVERLLQFITQYNAFIDQGGKFYEKFRIILNSYENEKPCQSKLPPEFGKLKQDIDLAIDKFNTAYKPVELNGSKMKEILYGINEFD